MGELEAATRAAKVALAQKEEELSRCLHSFTFQLNLSRVWHTETPCTPCTPPNTPLTWATQTLRAPPIPYKALKLSWTVDQCKPLELGCLKLAHLRARALQQMQQKKSGGGGGGDGGGGAGRGLHSSTVRLNLSALCGTRGARRGCVARVKGVSGVCGVFPCVSHGSS